MTSFTSCAVQESYLRSTQQRVIDNERWKERPENLYT